MPWAWLLVRHFWHIVLETGKAEVKVLSDSVSGEDPFLTDDIFYVSSHDREKKQVP